MYEHGISVMEKATSIEQPKQTTNVQVIFGTAPVNLAVNITDAVNKPILAKSFEEAKQKLGYSEDWDKYTLCQSMDASFKQLKVSPVVFVNVLDPTEHKKTVADELTTVTNQEAKISKEGVLLDTLVVKSSDGVTSYIKNTDYLADFNNDGQVVISVLSGGNISGTEVKVSYDYLDPSMVTDADVIGGYDSATNTYTGIETVQTVYPKFAIVPSLLLAPGFSHKATVGAVLIAKTAKINGSFNAQAVLDVEGLNKDQAILDKGTKQYSDKSAFICWPKAKIGDRTYWYSAIVAALLARTDAENDGVPYKSPSNKPIPVTAMVNASGQEIYLDQVQGNTLNAKGIVTALHLSRWRAWGNNTSFYDADSEEAYDPKDRFIAIRRMFDWWGNSFIQNYFEKVDDPANYRLIESIVDSENIRANGFQARGQIAGARIEFRASDNPISQILNGKIRFTQKIGFYTPAEVIENELEFDPTILSDALIGGE